METTEKDLVVGFGLRFSALEIAAGRVDYDRVKAVWFLAPEPLDDEKIEIWLREMQRRHPGEAFTSTVRRLWADNKVLQPELFKIALPEGERWKSWDEYIGGNDEPAGEGSR